MRVCRVRPDLPAVDKVFDYVVPDGSDVVVGTIVRVPLHGRRVRGWVVAVDVESDTDPARLRPLAKVVGAGPPAELVALADWAAWRWAGSPVSFLRAASPSLIVPVTVSDRSAHSASSTVPLTVSDRSAHSAAGVPDRRASARSLHTAHRAGDVTLYRWAPAAARAELVRGLLAPEGSTIVVLPDGRRTTALVRALRERGGRVVVLRADRSPAERTAAWRTACGGDCVVVGGRSAVWAPVPDLAAIVVFDEGDEALKEERAPAWHARDMAVERARRVGAHVALVSPTPSPEAEVAADEIVRPPRPQERAGWPVVDVVDRRADPPGIGLLSAELGSALRRALDSGGRAVCVLNRRGRARLLACVACGELARCEACGAAVVEADDGTLACPRGDPARPKVCVHCHAMRMKVLRPGVARVRDDLAALLPRATVAEVDVASDSVDVVDVLVGTEAVLHRVPDDRARPVRLVGFLDFDQELLATRARAAEQALWLLVRAARLVGPRAGPGRLLVQSRLPEHDVIVAATRGDPTLVSRRPGLGPAAAVSGEAAAVGAFVDGMARAPGVTVLGPTPDGTRALVRATTTTVLCDALAGVAPNARAHGRLRVEVDPLRI